MIINEKGQNIVAIFLNFFFFFSLYMYFLLRKVYFILLFFIIYIYFLKMSIIGESFTQFDATQKPEKNRH